MRPTTEELLSSSHDTTSVEVEGVVRKFETSQDGLTCMTLLVGGHPCPVILPIRLGLSREQLVDAKVRVRGVLLNIANLRFPTAGMKLHGKAILMKLEVTDRAEAVAAAFQRGLLQVD